MFELVFPSAIFVEFGVYFFVEVAPVLDSLGCFMPIECEEESLADIVFFDPWPCVHELLFSEVCDGFAGVRFFKVGKEHVLDFSVCLLFDVHFSL